MPVLAAAAGSTSSMVAMGGAADSGGRIAFAKPGTMAVRTVPRMPKAPASR
jgi:hypothetical protein